MRATPRRGVPYCTDETAAKIGHQKKLMKMGGQQVEYAMEENVLTPRGIHALIIDTICQKCQAHVDDIQAEHYAANHWYRFVISCHGQKEIHELTEMEYVQFRSKGFKPVAFANEKPIHKLGLEQLKLEG